MGHPSKSPFFLAWVLLGVAGLWLRLTRHVCVWGEAEVGPGLIVAGTGLGCGWGGAEVHLPLLADEK